MRRQILVPSNTSVHDIYSYRDENKMPGLCLRLLLISLLCSMVRAEISGFDEDLSDGAFDAPHWELFVGDAMFVDGGYQMSNPPSRDGTFDQIGALVTGSGDFVTTIEIRDLTLGSVRLDDFASRNHLTINHSTTEGQFFTFSLQEHTLSETGFWGVFGGSRLGTFTGSVPQTPPGATASLQIEYKQSPPTSIFLYDNDITDNESPIRFGPIETIDLSLGNTIGMDLTLGAFMASGPPDGPDQNRADGLVTQVSVVSTESSVGDFNSDGQVDILDIDLLTAHILSGGDMGIYDINRDSIVDIHDRTFWIQNISNTFFGDTNLDGEFSSVDLVIVFEAAEYEDNIPENSTWADGDWNGDGEFTSRDLVSAFQDGGYERGPRMATTLPEPSYPLLLSFLFFLKIHTGCHRFFPRGSADV